MGFLDGTNLELDRYDEGGENVQWCDIEGCDGIDGSDHLERRRSQPGDTTVTCIGQRSVYSHCMLTIASRVDVMNRLGRAMADATRSRILVSLLAEPGYPAQLARDLDLTRTNVSNHLACLRGCGIVVAVPEGRRTRYEIADPHLSRALGAVVDVVLAVDDGVPCTDSDCEVPMCCGPGADPSRSAEAERAR